jgi:hypothetical protein
MHILDDKHFMMIEPKDPIITETNDALTLMAVEVMMEAKAGTPYLGFHTCVCGAMSESYDVIMPDGRKSNSLAVHYVQMHRAEVPRSEIMKLLIYSRT